MFPLSLSQQGVYGSVGLSVCLIYVRLALSLTHSLSLSLSLCLYWCVRLSMSLSVRRLCMLCMRVLLVLGFTRSLAQSGATAAAGLSIYLSIDLPLYLSLFPSIYLIHLSYLSILSIYLS